MGKEEPYYLKNGTNRQTVSERAYVRTGAALKKSVYLVALPDFFFRNVRAGV